MERKLLVAVALWACAGIVHAQAPAQFVTVADRAWYGGTYGGRSVIILGSEDLRAGGGFFVAYSRNERQLRFEDRPGEFVIEGYFGQTRSNGVKDRPPNLTTELGLVGLARYRYPWTGSLSTFIDVGWGLQYTSQRTNDLNSRLNSSPIIGYGVSIPTHGTELTISLRLLHLSNAGMAPPNKGQNQLLLSVGMRF
jgi:hypothetical protein